MKRKDAGGYLLSLPERVVRSITGLTAGAAREIGEIVLPARLRRSRLYKSLVDSTLRFLIENVAEFESSVRPGDEPLPADFFIRRASGNVVELAGILTFHASPVWVFAAISDLAGGGRELIEDIAKTLEEQGLLDRNGAYTSVDQLLDGLERTSGRLAETVNTPPLDIASLREEWAKLRADASGLPRAALPDPQRLFGHWRALKQEAQRQERSVLDLSSVLAVSAVRSLPENAIWLSRVIAAGGWRAGSVIGRGLLDHYADTLSGIHREGYGRYWMREFRPYLEGAARQFSREKDSTTQRFLRRRGSRLGGGSSSLPQP